MNLATGIPEGHISDYIFEKQSRLLHVALPAKVVLFDDETATVDIQPMGFQIAADGERHRYPVIEKVPIATYRAGGFVVTVPIKTGDEGLAVFCDKNTDFLQNASYVNENYHYHELTDAIFIPGIAYPLRVVKDWDTEKISIRNEENTARITIAPDGDIEIHTEANIKMFAAKNIEMLAYENIEMGAYGNIIGAAVNNVEITAFDTMKVSGNNVEIFAENDIQASAYNDVKIGAANDAEVSAFGNVKVGAISNVEVATIRGDVKIGAASNVEIMAVQNVETVAYGEISSGTFGNINLVGFGQFSVSATTINLN